MLTAGQIGKVGEVYVSNWLAAKGYSGICNTQLPGSTDIEANGYPTSLLVQVKTAVWPNLPAEVSPAKVKAIVARATKANRQAWSARVQINDAGELLGEIAWKRLS